MAFNAKVAASLISDIFGAELNYTQEGALDVLRKISKVLGRGHEGSQMLASVRGNKFTLDVVEYTFDGGLVLDRQNHAFRGMVLSEVKFDYKSKRSVVQRVVKLDPISSFMLLIKENLNQLLGSYKGLIQDNLGPNLEKCIADCGWSTATSDEFSFLDGGSKHVLLNSYVPISVNGNKYRESSSEELQSIIPVVLEQYGDGHSFKKGVFHSGSLLHISVDGLSDQARAEIVAYMASLGVKVELTDDSVILLSSKEAKGPARITLPLAQVAQVEGGKPCGWLLDNQREAIVGTIVKAGFFPTLAFPPGQSPWVGSKENLPVGLIDHVYRGFEVDGLREATSQSVHSFKSEPVSVEKDGNWWVASFEGCTIKTGDVIAQASDCLVIQENLMEGDLQWVRWQVATTVGSKKRLCVEWDIRTVERTYKGRSIAKSQPVVTSPRLVYNQLNGEVAEMDVIHGQDGIKCDVVYSWLLPIATTARHNNDEELLAMIEQINLRVEGTAHREYLRIDPTWVVRGAYEQLQQAFERKYARSLWFNFRSAGDLGTMMYEMYIINRQTGWQVVEVPADVEQFINSEYPKGRQVLVAVADGPVEQEKTNVLVFILDTKGHVKGYLQRAYGFAGCCNCEGFEVATVATAVTSSQQMASYIRSLARLSTQPEAWAEEMQSMMDAGHDKRLLVKALHVMNTGLVEEGAKVYDLRHASHVEALRQHLSLAGVDFSLAANKRSLFTDMTRVLSGYQLRFTDELVVWLPVLYKLSRVESDSDGGMSVSNIVRAFMLGLLNNTLGSGEEYEKNYALMCRRIKGMMKCLLENKNNRKLQGGRLNSMAKRIALPQVPCHETWVLYSDDKRSAYQQLKKQLRGAVEGAIVAGNRAPMCDGTVTRVRVISVADNEKMFYQLSAEQYAISPMGNNIDGGDFDGDGHGLTHIASKVPLTYFNDVRRIRSSVLGVDMFSVHCNAYARDHYGIKRFAQVQLRPAAKSFKTTTQYVDLMCGAAAVQTQMVGASYTVCNMTEVSQDILAGLSKAGVALPTRLSWVSNGSETVARAYELYEVALGGYSKGSYKLWVDFIQPMSSTRNLVQIRDMATFDLFLEEVVAMGGNTASDAKESFKPAAISLAGAFNTTALFCFIADKVHGTTVDSYLLETLVKEYDVSAATAEMLAFAACASYAVYESGRGNLVGLKWVDGINGATDENSVADVMDFLVQYYTDHRSEEWFMSWVDNSPVLTHFFKHVLKDIATAAIPVYQGLPWLSTTEIEEIVSAVPAAPVVGVDGELLDLTPQQVEDYEIDLIADEVSDFQDYEDAEGDLWSLDSLIAQVTEVEAAPTAAVEEVTAEEVVAEPIDQLVSVITSAEGEGEGYVVALFSAMAEEGEIKPCSNNFPVGLTGGFAADVRPSGYNYPAFGLTKTNTMLGFYESPIGFMALNAYVLPEGGREQWVPMVRTYGCEVPRADFTTVVLNTKVNNKSDLDLCNELEIGKAGYIRQEVREQLLSGESGEAQGFSIHNNQGVMDILNDGERHFFAVIGKVVESKCTANRKGHRQCRVAVASMAIVHLDKGRALTDAGIAAEVNADALVARYAQLLG